MVATLNQRIERFLFRWGFEHPDVRALVRNQVYLFAVGSAVLLAATMGSAFSWSFAAGGAIITANFWCMAKAVQKLVYVRKGGVTALVILFYGRLIVTGLAILGLLVLLDASATGLLAGLSTVVVSAIIWAAANMLQKVKEA